MSPGHRYTRLLIQGVALTKISRLVVLLAALSLVAAACGDDDDTSDDTSGGGGSTSVTVSGSEFAFDPDSAAAAADTPIEVAFSNVGAVEHNWTILSENISAESDLSEDIVVFTLTAAPGSSASGSLPGLSAGTYQVVCSIPGHVAAGMVGELVVSG